MTISRHRAALLIALAVCAFTFTACGSDASVAEATVAEATSEALVPETPVSETAPVETPVTSPVPEPAIDDAAADMSAEVASGPSTTFVAEVWADNWFALWVNGEPVGEDSVPITTERSFNAETITFEATYPLTIAIEAKDFTETDSGLEYIGEPNQQMGDGGIILQVTDVATAEVVAVSDGSWAALVEHRAPLNVECEKSADPNTECQFEIIDTPADWAEPTFDTTDWGQATVWTAAAVSPKGGYDEIDWDPAAQLIWGPDLEVDNTVLLRTTVGN